MCGIAGIWNFRDGARAEAAVAKMSSMLAHRGPDAHGFWQNDQVALGHRRLSIIDTSAAGNQPFHLPDKNLVIVFNGEIYNYIELKRELAHEHQFATNTDTEVILAAYGKWGIDCINKFTGMLAFALWDGNLKKLFIVRDRLGVKPLYYAQTADGLVFASELRPILHSGFVERKTDDDSLVDYLRYQTVHAPRTLIREVAMLMPGHYIECSASGILDRNYWNAGASNSNTAVRMDGAEIRAEIFRLLQRSIELRMRADVPFGAFLSGGIDSSVVVGLMSRVATHKVKTFSITFHEKEFDEGRYSKLISDRFQTDHTEIKLGAKNFLELVPEALAAMDHPSGDGPNTYVVSKKTREAGIKMALSGLGGDELFAGYDVFRRMKALEHKRWLKLAPPFMRTLSGKFLAAMKPSVAAEKIAESLRQPETDFAHLYHITRQVFLDNAVSRLMPSVVLSENAVEKIARGISATGFPLLSKVSLAEIFSYMQNVLLRDTDQMSMANALEVREPFLDHHLVEFLLGVRDDTKYPHTPKQLLTESMGDLIPREVIDRPKMGFTFPWGHWMKNDLRPVCEQNLASLQSISALDHKEVMRLWQKFLAGDPTITWSRLWPLVVLGNWINQHDVG